MDYRFLFWFSIVFVPLTSFAKQSEHTGHEKHGKMEMKETKAPEMQMGAHLHPMGPADCSEMEIWDYSFGMCTPLPMPGMSMSMAMIHGNAFLVGVEQEGPRGKSAIASPNMVMGDIGKILGDRHYISVNLMLTAEKWTLPKRGYPELLQIGEERDGTPYIDAQHPHSSPIMGLTLSDTIRLGETKDHLKLFFAPRGQATDGPTAFMHRPTGIVNPDAPLGHHIGQDVSHITSTVIGASLGLDKTRLEFSTFNGTEPEPAEVNLPIGTPNSYASRVIQEISDDWTIMGSAAYVKEPEVHDPSLERVWRYSASIYSKHKFASDWMLHNTFIFGLVNGYDRISALRSFLDEFWLHSGGPSQIWGRVELLERAPIELAIPSADPNDPKWVTAVTLGYTHKLAKLNDLDFSLGASATKDFLPSEFRGAYGGDPLSGKIFLQMGGMSMKEL